MAVALAVSLAMLPAADAQATARSANAKPAEELRTPAAKPGKVKRAAKLVAKRLAVLVEPVRTSFGHLSGLQRAGDALDLKSSVALVVDQDTDEVLFSKNQNYHAAQVVSLIVFKSVNYIVPLQLCTKRSG